MKSIIAIILFLFSAMFIPSAAYCQTYEWKMIHQGNNYFKAKNYSMAETYYRRALQANQRNARAYFNLGDVYMARNNPNDAKKMFETAASLENNKTIKAMAYHNLGVMEQTKRQYSQAIEYYKKALRNNPNDEDTRYNLALCQKLLKNGGKGGNSQKQQPKGNSPQNQNSKQNSKQNQNPKQNQNDMSESSMKQLLDLSKQAEKQTRAKIQRDNSNNRSRRSKQNW